MKPIAVETRIQAPPARVFAVFTDLPNAAGRIRAIRKLELLTDGPVGKGTRFRETRVMFGREATETMEIIDFQPGRSYTVTAESCGARYLSTFTFEPDGPGTRVRFTFGATPVSLFGRLLSPLMGFMAKSMTRLMEAECADLRAACEEAPAAREPRPASSTGP